MADGPKGGAGPRAAATRPLYAMQYFAIWTAQGLWGPSDPREVRYSMPSCSDLFLVPKQFGMVGEPKNVKPSTKGHRALPPNSSH